MRAIVTMIAMFFSAVSMAAIQKNITTDTGFVATYVFIDKIEMSFGADECVLVSFSVYKDKDAYDAGKLAVAKNFIITQWCGDDNPIRRAAIDAVAATVADGDYYTPIYGSIYAKAIAEIPEFADGTLVP